MPAIFRSECSACGHLGVPTSDGGNAIYCDEPFPTEHPHTDDPQLFVLHHPGEGRALEVVKRHLAPDRVDDRWVKLEPHYCHDCGHLFETRRLAALSRVGCSHLLACLVASTGVGIWVWWQADALPVACFSGLVGFSLTAIALLWVASVLDAKLTRSAQRRLEAQHPERVQRVNTPQCCPNCSSSNIVPPRKVRQSIPCEGCGQRTVRVRLIGKS